MNHLIARNSRNQLIRFKDPVLKHKIIQYEINPTFTTADEDCAITKSFNLQEDMRIPNAILSNHYVKS